MCPSIKAAVLAVSTKVLMPFLNYNHLTSLRQILRPRQLLDLEALRLSNNNSAPHIEDRFTVALRTWT